MKRLFLAVTLFIGMAFASAMAQDNPKLTGVDDFGDEGIIISTSDGQANRYYGNEDCTDDGCLGYLAGNLFEEDQADSLLDVRVAFVDGAVCFFSHNAKTGEVLTSECAPARTEKPDTVQEVVCDPEGVVRNKTTGRCHIL